MNIFKRMSRTLAGAGPTLRMTLFVGEAQYYHAVIKIKYPVRYTVLKIHEAFSLQLSAIYAKLRVRTLSLIPDVGQPAAQRTVVAPP